MKQDQLQQARLTRWRQDGNALVTLDDAERWLAETPLCLFLPRYQHLPVPAPSFVEAVAGRPDGTPGPEPIAAASQMLARLVASGAVIALNLFGSSSGIVGEQPDFLATPEALPYLYALQPERNPKREPSTVGASRVSPLAAEAWKLLEREGALTAVDLRERLGREVTEAATLRALGELWHSMRVVPVPDAEGAPAHWELLSARHRRELNIGSTQSQTTALSILASFYLQSAIAASPQEVEIFLSPLASRSRIRDVVHGLSTTRQLASFPLNGEEQLYVEGTLPEIVEEEPVVLANGTLAGEDAGALDAGLEQNEPDLTEAVASNPPALIRERTRAPQRSPRPAFGERARGSFAARDRSAGRPPRRQGGFGRPQRQDSRGRASDGAERRSEDGEGTGRPPRPNFERRARPDFAASSQRRERPSRPGEPSRPGGSDRASRFRRSDRPDRPERAPRSDRPQRGAPRSGPPRGGFDRARSPRPGGSSFRRGKPFPGKPSGERPAREGFERPRFRPEGRSEPRSGAPRFGQDRPGRPPRDGERPRSFGKGRSFGAGQGQGAPRSDRPFRGPRGDRPAGGPRRFGSGPGATTGRPDSFSRPPRRDGESRRPVRDGESSPQGDRPFKRPYSPGGGRFPRSGPAGKYGKPGDRPERRFTPRPGARSSSDAAAGESSERPSRPFRASGQRPGGFSKSAAGSGSFRKPGPPGKSFGKPRPAGAGSGRPRPTGGEKNRTSTTTSSGKPRRPGGFGPARPGASGRPPAEGGFKKGGFKPGGKPFAGKRPGGLGASKRKPRSEGDEG